MRVQGAIDALPRRPRLTLGIGFHKCRMLITRGHDPVDSRYIRDRDLEHARTPPMLARQISAMVGSSP